MINDFVGQPSSGFDLGERFQQMGDTLSNQFGKVHTFLENQLTGNLDFERQKDLNNMANAFTALESAKARSYNSQQAQLQREFEERMSNTAYSRAFADMRKNGINPYAMISSASTPSGAVASAYSGRGASSSIAPSGRALLGFIGEVVATAFQYAGKALAFKSKSPGRQYFDADGVSKGGYIDL